MAEWSGEDADISALLVHVDPARYGRLAATAGLTVTGLTVTDRHWDFGTRERFARWCSVGSTASTDRLKVADRALFVDELVKAYEAVAGRPGLFRFTQMRVELVRQ